MFKTKRRACQKVSPGGSCISKDLFNVAKKVNRLIEVSKLLLDPRNHVLSLPNAIPGGTHAAYGRSTPSEFGDRLFSIFLELSASDFRLWGLVPIYFFFKSWTITMYDTF